MPAVQMTWATPRLEHVVGTEAEGEQRCRRCGAVLRRAPDAPPDLRPGSLCFVTHEGDVELEAGPFGSEPCRMDA